MQETIEEHRKTFDAKQLRDVIDAFLGEAATSRSPSFSPEQVMMCALDLFSGGSETTSKSLQTLLAFMILHPEVQEQVYQELLAAAPGRQVHSCSYYRSFSSCSCCPCSSVSTLSLSTNAFQRTSWESVPVKDQG